MALRIPPLNSLRTFVMAARKGSFLEAANELHITPAAVSRSIRSLEDHLGFPLFHRSHRQVRLTDEGERYLRELGDVFERITLATQNLVAERTKRPLVVCSYPSFMIDWLIPRWSRVHKSDPRIELKFLRVQRIVLKDHRDVAVLRRQPGDIPSTDNDCARRGLVQTGDHP